MHCHGTTTTTTTPLATAAAGVTFQDLKVQQQQQQQQQQHHHHSALPPAPHRRRPRPPPPPDTEEEAQAEAEAAAAAAAGAAVASLTSVAVDIRDEYGRTPLMLACGCGQLQSVELFLCLGADPNAVDDEGVTPLMKAASCRRDSSAVLHTLLQHGALPGPRDFKGYGVASYLVSGSHLRALHAHGVSFGGPLSTRSPDGETLLMYLAARPHRHSGLVLDLLRAGVPVNEVDACGSTALDHAAECMPSTAAETVVEALLQRGAVHGRRYSNRGWWGRVVQKGCACHTRAFVPCGSADCHAR